MRSLAGPHSSRATRVGFGALTVAAKLGAVALALALPLLAVWLCSSLAAYQNGTLWVAAALGIALCPGAPLLWEAISHWRRSRRQEPSKQFLTFGDRFIVRTVVVSSLFLGVMLWTYPQQAFRALQSRGDWMLDGRTGPTSLQLRGKLFWLADRLEWLYEGDRHNPYEQYSDAGDNAVVPAPSPVPITAPVPQAGATESDPGELNAESEPAPMAASGFSWPMREGLHPAVANIPPAIETDYGAVSRYLAEQEPDPYLRVKAIHDYVANRVAYDQASLDRGEYPPQDAETVFATRLGVCAGYAQLFKAMATEVGIEAVYVTGDARQQLDSIDGDGHAWNAVRIEQLWYLVDVTWDAGASTDRSAWQRSYRSDYLLAPPEVFGLDHLPESEQWQLRADPISRGEFLRQPRMLPKFFYSGLELLSPDRAIVDASGSLEVSVRNRGGQHLIIKAVPRSGADTLDCQVVTMGSNTDAVCHFPRRDTAYDIRLFASSERYGRYDMVGQLLVHNR